MKGLNSKFWNGESLVPGAAYLFIALAITPALNILRHRHIDTSLRLRTGGLIGVCFVKLDVDLHFNS